VDIRSNLLRAGDVLDGAALDKYSFLRDSYLQRRRAEIFDSPKDQDGNAGSDSSGDGQIPAEPASPPAAPASR
jgi:phospholipid-binding lipoprotein MlaA